MSYGLDALIPALMIGLPIGLITLYSELTKKKKLRGATRHG